jgi:hypothetical protein
MHIKEAQIHQAKLPEILSEANAYVPFPLQHSQILKKDLKKKVNKNLLTLQLQMKMTRVMSTLRVKRQLQPVYRNHHPLVPEGLIMVVHKRREILLRLNKATATPRTSNCHTCTCRRRRKLAVPNVATKKRHTPRPVCTALLLTLQMQRTAQSTK